MTLASNKVTPCWYCGDSGEERRKFLAGDGGAGVGPAVTFSTDPDLHVGPSNPTVPQCWLLSPHRQVEHSLIPLPQGNVPFSCKAFHGCLLRDGLPGSFNSEHYKVMVEVASSGADSSTAQTIRTG